MTAPQTLLRLMWLASPALPVGGFSYSEGLESAVDAGQVGNEAQAGDWLVAQLRLSQARSDLALAAQAHRAWRESDTARVAGLNDWVLATRESAEFRLQAEQMGPGSIKGGLSFHSFRYPATRLAAPQVAAGWSRAWSWQYQPSTPSLILSSAAGFWQPAARQPGCGLLSE